MSRKKVTIQAHELSEMDVNIISLVKRGANRVPFRIVKNSGDSKMPLDLSTLFWATKSEKAPSVAAVVVKAGTDTKVYEEALKAEGFEVHAVNAGDEVNTIVLSKSSDLDNAVALKINDDIAVVVDNMQKGLETFAESTSFTENINKSGFIPSLRVANDILMDTVFNVLFTQGDAAATKSSVESAIEEFKGYTSALLSAIPEQAFKAEKAIVEKGLLVAPAAEAAPAEDKVTDSVEAQKDESDADAETGDTEATADVEKNDSEAEATAPADADTTVEATKDGEAETEEQPSATDQALVDVQAAVGSITEALKGLSENVTSMKDELSGRLDATEAKLKKTDEAISGVALSEDADDVQPETTATQKSTPDWGSHLNFGDFEIS